MSGSNNAKNFIVIVVAAIVACLAGFVASAGSATSGTGSDAELGAAIGRGLAAVLIVCALAHFVFLRKQAKHLKWIAFGAIAAIGLVGCIFGVSI